MPALEIDKDAEQDIEVLWASDADAAAVIEATLELIDESPHLQSMLTSADYGRRDADEFDAAPVGEFQRKRLNIWRLKVWGLEDQLVPYRVLYALDIRSQRHYVLAVIHREHCYNPTHPRVRQVIRRYEALGITELPY